MPRRRKKKPLGATLDEHMKKRGLSSKQLAALLTEAGVPADKRKVVRWRKAEEGKTISADSAVALDQIFETVHVFDQYIYKPEFRGTQAALAGPAADYVKRSEFDELRRRLEQLEGG